LLQARSQLTLRSYECGRLSQFGTADTTAQVDIYCKRCNVNLILLRYDDAAEDLAQAISRHAQSKLELLATKLVDCSIIKSWLHNRSMEDPLHIASQLPRALRDLANRLRLDLGIYRKDSSYDLTSLSSGVGPLALHVDVASYIGNTEIRDTSRHGRGLFATQDIKAGNLIMAEKAFALPGYLINDPNSHCSLYSLGDDTATDRAGALLLRELVQKLHANPSMRQSFFDMDDGGYWAESQSDTMEGEIPVDV
jgi:hypothetical protein